MFDLKKLEEIGESDVYELKKNLDLFDNKGKFIKSVISFSNSHERDDKFIIFGVKEMKSRINNVIGVDASRFDEASVSELIHNNITPKVDFKTETISIDNEIKIIVLIIKAENFDNRPFISLKEISNNEKRVIRKGDIFIRKNTSNLEITRDDLDRIYKKKYKSKTGELSLKRIEHNFNSDNIKKEIILLIDSVKSIEQKILAKKEYIEQKPNDDKHSYNSNKVINGYHLLKYDKADIFMGTKVEINDETKKVIEEFYINNIDKKLDDNFFDLHNLRESFRIPYTPTSYIGSEHEKNKNDEIDNLLHKINEYNYINYLIENDYKLNIFKISNNGELIVNNIELILFIPINKFLNFRAVFSDANNVCIHYKLYDFIEGLLQFSDDATNNEYNCSEPLSNNNINNHFSFIGTTLGYEEEDYDNSNFYSNYELVIIDKQKFYKFCIKFNSIKIGETVLFPHNFIINSESKSIQYTIYSDCPKKEGII